MLIVILVTLFGTNGCNRVWNNYEKETPEYTIYSKATFWTGHVEYIKYSSGAQDVKVYPGIGHRLWDSELHLICWMVICI